MEDGLVKINSVKQNLKTVMIGYEDGKLLRMKGTVIPRHSDFAGAVTTGISPIRLWHVRYGHLNFGVFLNCRNKEWLKDFPLSKGKMQNVKLAFMANKIEKVFQQVHGVQTGVCNWCTMTFVDLYRLF